MANNGTLLNDNAAVFLFQLQVCKEQLSKEVILKNEVLRQKECIQSMLQTKSSVSLASLAVMAMCLLISSLFWVHCLTNFGELWCRILLNQPWNVQGCKKRT